MHVEIALFEGDQLLGRTALHAGPTQLVSASPLFQATHRLGSTAADIVLSNFPAHIDLKTVTLDIPVHESSDWESIEAGKYTLAFWCRIDI